MPKAKRVLRRLLSLGFEIVHRVGSHRKLKHPDGRQFTFAHHDIVDLGPPALAKVAKQSGCKADDLI